jgi:hypothetical protein
LTLKESNEGRHIDFLKGLKQKLVDQVNIQFALVFNPLIKFFQDGINIFLVATVIEYETFEVQLVVLFAKACLNLRLHEPHKYFRNTQGVLQINTPRVMRRVLVGRA